MRSLSVRLSLLIAASLVAFAFVVAPAGAVLGGTNGNILFTSGRDGGDSVADLYLRFATGSFGFGSVSGPVTNIGGIQHKHATWSPDREKIAYSAGIPGTTLTEDLDIYIKDLTTGVVTPLTNTGDGLSADRPAWSPDGKLIAYEQEMAPNNTGERDLYLAKPDGSASSNLTLSTGVIEGDAAWTPDSQTIYYQVGNPTAVNTLDIMKRPASGIGAPSVGVPNSSLSEFQPSISPDGSKICFTIGSGFNGDTDIMVALTANPASQYILSNNPNSMPITNAMGDINCAWSPDGTKITYAQGVFGSAALVMRNSDATGLVVDLSDVANVFDGNPDWAPDGRPNCQATTVAALVDTPITIPISCPDTGPDYEQTPVTTTISEQPTFGTLDPLVQGPPSSVVYRPKAGFIGTDTFKFNGFDAAGFAGPAKTITVNVVKPAPPATGTIPKVTKLSVAKKITKANKNTKLSTKKKGTTISFSLSEPATVTLTFKRTGKAKTSATKGSLTLAAKAGLNRVVFKGKLSKSKALALGKYKLSLVATNAAGGKSTTSNTSFTLR